MKRAYAAPFRSALLASLAAGLLLCTAACFATSSSVERKQPWPLKGTAQRDFVTANVFLDDHLTPGRVWLISQPMNGAASALEFFSGEIVGHVQISSDNQSVTFTDAHGHRYNSEKFLASNVNLDSPSSNAEWNQGDMGHIVVLGTQLGSEDGPAAKEDPRQFFGGQASCEPAPYVARTDGSTYQDSEPGFVAQTKIIADFDKTKGCWATKPLHYVSLEDNTFLLITQDRAFRINSKDLTPAGTAPDLSIINIKDK